MTDGGVVVLLVSPSVYRRPPVVRGAGCVGRAMVSC